MQADRHADLLSWLGRKSTASTILTSFERSKELIRGLVNALRRVNRSKGKDTAMRSPSPNGNCGTGGGSPGTTRNGSHCAVIGDPVLGEYTAPKLYSPGVLIATVLELGVVVPVTAPPPSEVPVPEQSALL